MFSLASVDQTTVSAFDCRPNVCRPNDWRPNDWRPNDWRQMTSCFWNFWVLLRPERELKLSNGSHPDPGDDLSRVYRSRLSSFDLAQPEKSLKMLSKRFARKRFKKFWAAQRAHRPFQLDPKKVSGFKSWLCFDFSLFVWLIASPDKPELSPKWKTQGAFSRMGLCPRSCDLVVRVVTWRARGLGFNPSFFFWYKVVGKKLRTGQY